MALLDGGLKNIFGAAFGSIYLDGHLIRVTMTDDGEGGWSEAFAAYPIKGQTDAVTERMRLNAGYTDGDMRVLVLQAGSPVAPLTDDRVILGNEVWDVSGIEADPANTHWEMRGSIGTMPVPAVTFDPLTGDPTPLMSGTALAGATVEIEYDPEAPPASTTAAADGTWSTSLPELASGTYQIRVRQTLSGATSAWSAAQTLTVDTIAPAAPVITTASPFVTTNTSPEIAGTAEANSTVTVYVDGEEDGTTTANALGVWAYAFDELDIGSTYSITATATDAAGNESAASAALALTINPALAIVAPPLTETEQNAAYEWSFEITGGAGPFTAALQNATGTGLDVEMTGARTGRVVGPVTVFGLIETLRLVVIDHEFDGTEELEWDLASQIDLATLFDLPGANGILFPDMSLVVGSQQVAFQESTGITPVTAAGQAIGLMFSTAYLGQGIPFLSELGSPENWNGGTFGSFTGAGAGFTAEKTVSGGTDAAYSTDTFPVTNGKTYKIDIDIQSTTLSSYAVALSATTNGRSTSAILSGAGQKSAYVTANVADGNFSIRVATTATGEIVVNSATLSEVNSVPLGQTNSGQRPLYQESPARAVFDGSDDNWLSTLNPALAQTYIFVGTLSSASRVIMGSQPASDGRSYLATNADGKLAAGVGEDGTSTIFGGDDIRDERHVFGLRHNGNNVVLNVDKTKVYDDDQNGAANTTVPIRVGGLNNNGTAGDWMGMGMEALIAVNRHITDAEMNAVASKYQGLPLDPWTGP